jgi:hypothetical protein
LFDAQGTVVGRPFTEGVTENVQLVAFLTEAMSVTEPPVAISEVGVTLNEMTEGLAVLAAPTAATGTTARATTATRTAECLIVLIVRLTSLDRNWRSYLQLSR